MRELGEEKANHSEKLLGIIPTQTREARSLTDTSETKIEKLGTLNEDVSGIIDEMKIFESQIENPIESVTTNNPDLINYDGDVHMACWKNKHSHILTPVKGK